MYSKLLVFFLVNKFSKLPTRQLKSMIVDFYDVEEIVVAKEQLLSNVVGMKLNVDLPHIPRRRDGELMATRTIDFQTCKAGLVLSVTRILRPIPCVCMYVCMYVCICNYSSQTTEPICIKIIPANTASYADCYRLLRFEIFTKYDEYFVPESAPLLHRRIFATGTAAAYI